MCVLEDVPHERILFGAKDVGDKRLLNKGLIGSENLVSKVKAKVMFIQNLHDHIKNGVQDTVVSFLNGLPVVATASESLRVDRAAWPVYDQKNPTNIIGNRTHLPLKLAWAMTAQKAQGKHWVL